MSNIKFNPDYLCGHRACEENTRAMVLERAEVITRLQGRRREADEYIAQLKAEIAALKAEREKMKYCGNCKNLEEDYDGKRTEKVCYTDCNDNLSSWQLKED